MTYIDPKTAKLIDHVRPGKMVSFTHYRDGEFWYVTDDGLVFPVPMDDIGSTRVTLLAKDKAILFMRWIRRYITKCKTEKE
jgi:hypothetical protein